MIGPSRPMPGKEVLIQWEEYEGCYSWFVGYWDGTYWHAKKDHLKAQGHWECPSIDDDFKQYEIVGWKEI